MTDDDYIFMCDETLKNLRRKMNKNNIRTKYEIEVLTIRSIYLKRKASYARS